MDEISIPKRKPSRVMRLAAAFVVVGAAIGAAAVAIGPKAILENAIVAQTLSRLAPAPAAGGPKPPEQVATAPEALPRPVQVQPVKFERLVQPRVLVGTVRARVEADYGFRVGGKIARRKVNVGERVAPGMVLAELDATDFRLSRESAEAELAAAQSSARQAEQERDRIVELKRKGWSTDQAFDRQRAAVDEAVGRVRRAERQVELTANSQSYAELKADTAGTVMAVMAESGQVVAAGQAVFRIAQDGDREALVNVPEQDIAFARSAHAEVVLWSEPGKVYSARLRELSPNADPATRTFAGRYTLEGLAPDAPMGMTATLALIEANGASGARIPLSAILNEGGGAEVYIVDRTSATIMRRPVRVLAYDARSATIGEGLAEGDLVVTLGVHTLLSGQKVRLPAEARQGQG